MSKFTTAIFAAALATTFAEGGFAQTVTPRDAVRPSAELAAPASPRDGADRKDIDKDRSDADLAIERDKCGDLADDARERCIRAATAQRDRAVPPRGTATGMPASLMQPGSPNSTSPQPGATMSQPGATPGAVRR